MKNLEEIGTKARNAEAFLNKVKSEKKNEVLLKTAELLISSSEYLLKENAKDIIYAKQRNIKSTLIDRLLLSGARIKNMAEGLIQIANQEDPLGEIIYAKETSHGLKVGKKRVPLGVIGIIYEARPNVTSDAFGLCLKSGNVSVLKGGSLAINTNIAIMNIIRNALKDCGLNEDIAQLVEDTSRETALEMMKMNKYFDVLIPRGGADLIRTVVENSTIPVIETGVGNCHIYVDNQSDFEMARSIIINGKTQRPGVCNATESLLIHRDIAEEFIPYICNELNSKEVEIRGDETVCKLFPIAHIATEEDWGKEYLDLIISVKTVESIDNAIAHINRYSSKHSDVIVTSNYFSAQKFLDEVDSAAVYVNASSRFTDGMELGFGAEIGISTQKLHARGPMGLKELTSTKYIIMGEGQIRN